jgi:hypothetical protein
MQSLNDLDSQPEGSTMAESTKSSFSRNYRFSKKGSSLALFAPPPTPVNVTFSSRRQNHKPDQKIMQKAKSTTYLSILSSFATKDCSLSK